MSNMEPDVDEDVSSINISDVIEVIRTDPVFGSTLDTEVPREEQLEEAMDANGPRVKIIEQPASKALRFRYECEGRSAGSIPGINSTAENKTYPTIQIENYQGRAVVVVSCVTKDAPYRPHPHNLVGKEACKNGVCTMEVNTETMTLSFANLGIQCIKKRDIEDALRLREELRIDPFKTGFGHRNQPGSIDLNAVRLCFQVFLEGSKKSQFSVPIMPVVSEPIYDKKAMSDLVICKLSECSASVIGGKEIILLCEKVAKEDISVRLYEEQNGQVLWEGQADFQPSEVHKQVAILFKTPRYKNINVTESVEVMIQLLRPSDKATSEPKPFWLTPIDADAVSKRKRPKVNNPGMVELLKESEMQLRNRNTVSEAPQVKHEVKYELDQGGNVFPGLIYPGPGKLSPNYAPSSPTPPEYGAIAGPSGVQIPGNYTAPGYPMPSYAARPPPFSPSPPIQQVAVSPLPMSHQLDQLPMNNLSAFQQQSPMHRMPLSALDNLNVLVVDEAVASRVVGNIGERPVVGTFIDMDTHDSIELSAGRLDSKDLKELDGLDSVSENMSAQLNLNDNNGAVAGAVQLNENMTDSLNGISRDALFSPSDNAYQGSNCFSK